MLNSSKNQSRTTLGFVVLLAGAICGCHESRALIAPTPTPSQPGPTATLPSTTGSLYGVVTEMTSNGLAPIGGVVVAPLSCAIAICPSSQKSIYQEVTTANDGTYRVTGLYNSEFNYIWLGRGFELVGARPIAPCEDCDVIATVNGDTRLDIQVVRQ